MANNYWRGTTNSNSNTAANWSLGVVPTLNDGHVAVWDASSPDCTINATLNCNHVDFTAYTNTITFANQLYVNGNVTLGLNMNILNSSQLIVQVASGSSMTYTSNGKAFPNIIAFTTNTVVTLVGNATVHSWGSYNAGVTVTTNKTTNETLTVTGILGGLSISQNITIAGNVDIFINSGLAIPNNSNINNKLFINGNVSFTANTINLSDVEYLSGIVTCSTLNTVKFPNACTINTGTVLWNNVEFSGSNTKTLLSDLKVKGLFTVGGTTNNIVSNGFAINCASLKSNLTTGTMTGTTIINLSGLGINVSSTGISNTINTLTPTENIFTGATANWNTATNWSQGTVPTATDGYLTRFNASSPNCTVNAASMAVNAISFSGYTNTITMTNGLGIYGNTTLASGMSISGSGALTFNASGLLTGNGKTWSTPIIFSSHLGVNQLSGDWTNSGLCTITSANTISITKTSTEKLVLSGGLTHTGTTTNTAQIQMTGGTWSGNGVFNGDLDFNGNCTVSGSVSRGTGTITKSGGTVATAGSTITFYNSTILNVTGLTWNNVILGAGTNTFTLNNTLTINGTLTFGSVGGTSTITLSGSYEINCVNLSIYIQGTHTLSGNINCSGTLSFNVFNYTINGFTINCYGLATSNGQHHGTTTINCLGGTYTSGTAYVGLPLILTNTTLSGVSKLKGSLTLNSGNTYTGNTIETDVNGLTINGNNSLINNLAIAGVAAGGGITLSSDLQVNGTISCTVATSASRCSIKSNSVGTKRKLKLVNNLQDLGFVDFTDIDAREGYPIWTYKGIINNCNNVLQLNANSFVESQIILA
jgi:hypothetical protein